MALNRNNKILIGVLAGTVAALAAAGIVVAQVTDSSDERVTRPAAVTATVPDTTRSTGTGATPAPSTAPAAAGTGGPTSTPASAETITPADAVARAVEVAPGEPIEIELDDHRGRRVYQVHIASDSDITEITLDATTGEVLRTELDDDDDFDDLARAAQAELNALEAADVALASVPGVLVQVDLDDHRGVIVYEVDVRTDTGTVEVHVDAVTGEIVRPPVDDD